jgi:hypothetical protein
MIRPNALRTATLVSITAAATALVIQACGGGAIAQSANAPDPIVGVWDVDVTVKDCTSGASMFGFKSMSMMNAGGTMTGGADTFGIWKRESNGTYTVTLQFYLPSTDGSFTGTQKVKATRTLAADGNSYTSTITRWQVDADGKAGPTGCAAEAAKRATW